MCLRVVIRVHFICIELILYTSPLQFGKTMILGQSKIQWWGDHEY